MVDSNLKFHLQTDAGVKKANRILGIISKTIRTKSETTIPLLYTSLVRPHLEYANVVWGPKYKLDQQEVERVQRRATKMIENIKNLSYQERLRYLDVSSLLRRRLRGDMIETYKIVTGIWGVDKDIYFKQATHSITRGHCYKLRKQRAKTFLNQNKFSNRVINEWNNLPHIVESTSVNNFKNLLDKHLRYRKFETPFAE